MWLLSWIRDGKQQKLLFSELNDVMEYFTFVKDIGFLVEYIPVFIKPDPKAPKKESTYNRLVPLSDTTQKD